MRIHFYVLTAVFFSCIAAAQTTEWTAEFEAGLQAPTLYPNAESPTGVLVASGSEVTLLDGAGHPLWKTDVGEGITAPPSAADIDGDGDTDIVLLTSNATFVCLDADGSETWRTAYKRPGGGYKHVALGDVHPSPGLEVVAGFDDGYLRCLSAKGVELWRFCGAPFRVSPAAIGDATGDGHADVVYGTDDGQVYCLDGLGRIQWVHFENAPYGRSGPLIAPINGKPAVLITRSNVGNATCLMALDGASGSELWRTQDYMQSYVSIAAADIDGDGALEFFHADKGNRVYCDRADGTRVWEVSFMARGIFMSPVVADFDGDGALEIAVGARDSDSSDRATAYLIGADGSVEHRLTLGNGANNAPAAADIDGDGAVELFIAHSGPDQLQCISFGNGSAIAWPMTRGNAAMTGRHPDIAAGVPAEAPQPDGNTDLAVEKGGLRLGTNDVSIAWQDPTGAQAMLEVRTAPESGTPETRVFRIGPGVQKYRAQAYLAGAGTVQLHVALFPSSAPPIFRSATTFEKPSIAGLEDTAAFDAAAALADEAAWDAVISRSQRAYREAVDNEAPFIAFQDANPWDAFDPSLVPVPDPFDSAISVEAFGNEFESIALTVQNLTDETIDVRATFAKPNLEGSFGVPAVDPLHEHITLRRAVPSAQVAMGPFEYGADGQPFSPRTPAVFDALPEMDRSQSLTLPAGEARQIWLVVSTQDLEPGDHSAVLSLGILGGENYVQEVPVNITVWPVRLPVEGPDRMNWSRVDAGTIPDQQLQDMIDHGISVVYGPGTPRITLDYEGNVVDEGDWTAAKATLDRLPDYFQVYFHGPPAYVWKDGVAPEAGSDLDKTGLRNAQAVMTRKLAEFGWGYDRWAFYPYDEPWNTGETLLPGLRAFCEKVREADPKIRIYTDPTGGMNVERIAPFKDLIDIWQPEVNILKRDPELVKWFQENVPEFIAYEATDPGKNLKPLGYYRAWGWFAEHFGLEGWGWWVYGLEDIWWAHPWGDWSVVYPNGDERIPSRRWEAARDGVEDYKMLKLLDAAIATMPEDKANEARALRDAAVHDLATWQIGTIDEITRATRYYDSDFAKVQDYRKKIAALLVAASQP